MPELDLGPLPLVDTHEHLRPEAERLQAGADPLAILFRHYASTDLQTAGLSQRDLEYVRDPASPLLERWATAEPFWQAARLTGYGRAIRIALQDLYEIADLRAETLEALAERMRAAATPGLYHRVFDRAGIRWALVQDVDPGPMPGPADPPDCIRTALKAGPLVWIRSKAEVEAVVAQLGLAPVHSLQGWLEVCETAFERAPQAAAVKLALAYVSAFPSSRPTFHEAEAVFNRLERKRDLFGLGETLSWSEAAPLCSFLVFAVVEMAVRRGLPIQIHTGLLESTFNDIRQAQPLSLIPLLLEFREGRFAIFHGGYPWTGEFAALGKSFPNVWLDLSWLWVISPQTGRLLLHQLIESVPRNKITVFGGDYLFIEGTYGHSQLMRQAVTQVMDEKVASGWLQPAEAVGYARAIFADNAEALYSRAPFKPMRERELPAKR